MGYWFGNLSSMGYWTRVIGSVSTIRNFVITGDEILVWNFMIDGRLGKGDRSSLNHQKYCDNRICNIGICFCERWEIGKLFSGESSLNNQQFCDHRKWVIGLGFCDRWEIGLVFSDGISLKNLQFSDQRGWEIGLGFCDIWEIGQGFSDRINTNNHICFDNRGWDFWIHGRLGKGDKRSINNQEFRDHRWWEIMIGFCDIW